MPSVVTIDKGCCIKDVEHKGDENSLYKKCGFRKADGFIARHTWRVKVKDEIKNVQLWAKDKGRAGTENKYDLPPPIDKVLYYGAMCVVIVDEYGRPNEDLKATGWSKIYEGLFGGFEDLGNGTDDDNESDELDYVSDSMKTTDGYLKDGFVVDKCVEDGETSSETDDCDGDDIMPPNDDSDDTDSDGDEHVDAVIKGLSECSEEDYEYSDED
jgi:hypothetical protein